MMKKLKWILLWVACAALIVCVVGVTFGDVDNGETLYIEQTTLQRSGSGLELFEDAPLLIPANYAGEAPTKADTALEGSLVFTSEKIEGSEFTVAIDTTASLYNDVQNALDHMVFVTNLGNQNAYVRTWFAFELGDLSLEEFETSVELNRNETDWTWGGFEEITVDGQRYAMVRAEYATNKGALESGKTTEPSLLQLLLRKTVTSETAQRLDGNNDGRYAVLVTTHAVSDSTAWGSAVPNHPWYQNVSE